MQKKENFITVTLMSIFLMIVLCGPFFIVLSFIFKDLWNWFIAPLGLAPLNFFHSAGFSLLYLALIHPLSLKEPPKDKQIYYLLVYYIWYFVLWFVGFLLKDMI